MRQRSRAWLAAVAAAFVLFSGRTAAPQELAPAVGISLVPEETPLPGPLLVKMPEVRGDRRPLAGPLLPLGAPVKISAPLVPGGDVLSHQISQDGMRIIYLADQDVDNEQELYSVPVGGGPVTQLNPPLVAGGDVLGFAIALDSSRVVYLADQDTNDMVEAYSVPLTGGAVAKLNGPLIPLGDLSTLLVTNDSTHVIYLADQDTDGITEVYSAPIAGGGAVKINGPLVAGGNVTHIASPLDGSRAIYRADQITDEVFELFSAPIGGGAVTKLTPTPVPGGDVGTPVTSGSRVYFIGDLDANEVFEYYSVPHAGGPLVKLSKPLIAGGDVTNAFSSLTMSLYTADQDVDEVFEVYAVPAAGGPAIQLNPPLVPGGDVIAGTSNNPRIPDADMTALYRADQDVDGVIELYSVPLTGGPTTQLNAPLVAGGNVLGFGAAVSGTLPPRVVYFADQNTDETIEVYGVPLSGGAAAKLNGPLVAGGDLVSIAFNASLIAYLADQDIDGVNEIFYRTMTGLGPVTQLNAPLVAGGNVVGFVAAPPRVVYRADQDTDEVFELYSAVFDGDADGDAVSDGTDCLAYDPTVWDTPGEVTGLLLSHVGGAGGTTTLSWSAPSSPGGTSPVYDTLRSATASDFVTSASCVESDDGPNATATDSVTPPPGEVAFFLVRAQNVCDSGSLGTSSAGTPRAGRGCP